MMTEPKNDPHLHRDKKLFRFGLITFLLILFVILILYLAYPILETISGIGS